MLGRIRKFQDRAFFGTAGHPLHGKLPARDIDHYFNNRLVFDTAGVCGAIASVTAALAELSPTRIVFGSDYPQEIRSREDIVDYISKLRALGGPAKRFWRKTTASFSKIISENVRQVLSAWYGCRPTLVMRGFDTVRYRAPYRQVMFKQRGKVMR